MICSGSSSSLGINPSDCVFFRADSVGLLRLKLMTEMCVSLKTSGEPEALGSPPCSLAACSQARPFFIYVVLLD